MQALMEAVRKYLAEHWLEVLVALSSAFLGWWFGRRRARSEWQKREFLDRLNVSLTSIADGTLRIRTLLEKRCDDVFLNRHASATIVAAARETSEASPWLNLADDDYWFYLNAVLNEISEKFAEGQLLRDAGLPVKVVNYLICLTCESAGAIRTRKVRAMVVQESLLQKLPPDPPQFESPNHATRWQTLQALSAHYVSQPDHFLRVELCFPAKRT